MMIEKINFTYFAIADSGISISINVIDNMMINISLTHAVTIAISLPPKFIIDVIKMMKSSDAKNKIAPIVTREVPISPMPFDSFFDAIGSINRAVTL